MRVLQYIPTLFAVIAYLVLPSCAPDTASGRSRQAKNFEEECGYGIDLSHHNTVTDWGEVEADFIFLKATEGSTFTDPKYTSYRNAAQKYGIATGAYHFMTTSSSAKRQFQNFYRVVGENIDLQPVLDVEIQTKGYPKTQCAISSNKCHRVRPLTRPIPLHRRYSLSPRRQHQRPRQKVVRLQPHGDLHNRIIATNKVRTREDATTISIQ